MVIHKAQDLAARPRTEDIQISEDIDFKSMLLPKPILKGLTKSGYIRPSPIQRKALPLVRCGLDLIVQAKAGTGKTCVFAVAALELVQPSLAHLQAVVLAPTREIALQITEVITAVGQAVEGLKINCFIGGYPIALDEQKVAGCHIAIGAPGRMRHLMDKGLLNPSRARLFVLDEADKLMEKAFVTDINGIFSFLPDSKQVLAFSATYTPEMVQFLSNYMHQGQYVTPQQSTNTTVLIGIRQFVSVLSHHIDKLATLRLKERHLLYLLRSISFNQCLVFSNLHTRAVSVCNMLRKEGWGVEWIAGRQQQEDRVIALSQLKEQRVRVLVTTDLTSRGIDAENINLIINLDVPRDHQTYLHRMGRAGRYGSHGMVVTILSAGDELAAFRKLLGAIGGTSQSVNCVPEDLKNVDLWLTTDKEFEKVFGIVKTVEPVSDYLEESEENTESDEKLSQKLSDDCENTVINLCDEENVPIKDICSCNLYEVGLLDIKLVSGLSLFAISKKEEHWRDVLPVVVNESQIPLNTPVALLDSKLIKIKFVSNKSEDEINTIKEVKNPISPSDFVKSCDNKTNFLTFDEINSTIENGSNVQINLESKPCEIGNFLSSQDIEEILENNVTKCEVDGEIKNCATFIEMDQVLLKYQNNRTKLENILIGFDSFDVVGWMAVDEKHNIVENIINDELSVFEFAIIECTSGKRHIKVVSSFTKGDIGEGNFEDHISSLNVESFNLVQPCSLECIAEKLSPCQNVQQTKKESSTSRCCTRSFTVKESNNIPYPRFNEVLKNGYEQNSKSPLKEENQKSNKTNKQKISIKSPLKDNVPNYLKNCKSGQKNGHGNYISSSTCSTKKQIRNVSKQTQKTPCKSGSSVDPSKTNLPKEIQKKSIENSYHSIQKPVTDEIKNYINSNERSSELSNGSDTSSSEQLSEESSNPCRNKNLQHLSSFTSEESGPFIDMTQNLAKWQELHDCEESDSESSTESDVQQPNINNCVPKKFSDSTSSNDKTLQSAKNRRLPRQRRSIDLRSKKLSSDSYDSYESGISNHHSFRTACSQHLTSGEIYKEDAHLPPYRHDHNGHSKVDDHNHRQTLEKQLLNHSSRPYDSESDGHFPKRNASVPKASTSKAHQSCYDPYQYPDRNFTRQNKSEKKSSTNNTFQPRIPNMDAATNWQFPKRLCSNNLFYEWYTTWYAEVQQRAHHLEHIEYINTMSAP